MGKEGKFGRSDCATSSALEIIGDRWSLLIIRDFIFKGSRDYADFIDMAEGIASNILVRRLHWLTESGIFIRYPHPTNQKKYYYEITPKGFDLIFVIMDLAQWSWKHIPGAFSPPEVKRRFLQDRASFASEWKKRVKERSEEYLAKARS